GPARCTRMAIVHIDNSYGTAMARVVEQYFPTKGGTVIANITVPVETATDYKTQVQAILAQRPDCQALISYDNVGDQFMFDLKAAMANSPGVLPPSFFVVSTDGVYGNDFLVNGRIDKSNPKSPTVVEGIVGTAPDTNPLTREYHDFRNLYVAEFPLK